MKIEKLTLQREVNAEEMTRLEYNNLRGWTLPSDEKGNDEGYKLTTLDGKHISWSPKEVVESEQISSVKHKVKELLEGGPVSNNSRLIGGIPLLIILTLDGNSGQDLLDSLINWVQALSVAG